MQAFYQAELRPDFFGEEEESGVGEGTFKRRFILRQNNQLIPRCFLLHQQIQWRVRQRLLHHLHAECLL
jgi:hypothetical protein